MFSGPSSKGGYKCVSGVIHWINLYPPDSAIGFPNTYPLDSAIHLLNKLWEPGQQKDGNDNSGIKRTLLDKNNKRQKTSKIK